MRFLLADDHLVVREGLRQILAEAFPQADFAQASTVPETFAALETGSCDLLLLDLFMPGGGGLEVLLQLRQSHPQLRILVLSSAPEEQLALRMLQAGAGGYLNKRSAAEELVQAVQTLLTGGTYLSPRFSGALLASLAHPGAVRPPHETLSDREFQVLQLIVAGQSLKQIAAELGLSPKTISTFHSRLLQKLRLHNDVELVHYALQHRLLERPRDPSA